MIKIFNEINQPFKHDPKRTLKSFPNISKSPLDKLQVSAFNNWLTRRKRRLFKNHFANCDDYCNDDDEEEDADCTDDDQSESNDESDDMMLTHKHNNGESLMHSIIKKKKKRNQTTSLLINDLSS